MAGYVHAYSSFAVTGIIETKSIDFDLPGEGKTISEIQYEGYAPIPVAVTVSVSLDGGVSFYACAPTTVEGRFRAFAFPWRTAESFIVRFQGAPLYISNVIVQAIPNPGEHSPNSGNIIAPTTDFTKHWIEIVTPEEVNSMHHSNLNWVEDVSPTESFEAIGPGFIMANTWDNEILLYSRFAPVAWLDVRYGKEYPDPDYVRAVNGICNDRTYFWFTDGANHHKIVKMKCYPWLNPEAHWSTYEKVSEIGSEGSGNDQFDTPVGICTDGTHLYIVDGSNHRIVKRLCTTLAYVAQIGTRGSGDDQFEYPQYICTDNTYLYIADTNGHRIKKHLCSTLAYVSQTGSYGNPPGDDEFYYPSPIATDGNFVYVVDAYWHIKKFTTNLVYVSTSEKFSNIVALAIYSGILYATDSYPSDFYQLSLDDMSIIQATGELVDIGLPMACDPWRGPVP